MWIPQDGKCKMSSKLRNCTCNESSISKRIFIIFRTISQPILVSKVCFYLIFVAERDEYYAYPSDGKKNEDFLTKIHEEFNNKKVALQNEINPRVVKSAFSKFRKSINKAGAEKRKLSSEDTLKNNSSMKRTVSIELPYEIDLSHKNAFHPMDQLKSNTNCIFKNKAILQSRITNFPIKTKSPKNVKKLDMKEIVKTTEFKFEIDKSKKKRYVNRPYSGKPRKQNNSDKEKNRRSQDNLLKATKKRAKNQAFNGSSKEIKLSYSNQDNANRYPQEERQKNCDISSEKSSMQDQSSRTYKSSSMSSVQDYKRCSTHCVVSPLKLDGAAPKKTIQIRMEF
ncbi:unnamed protein product [Moneuplotes crassus]|uniref:Uncharacterized protein n=1 Tax=Euplotes crassus TaxID=5936 RepID=A0AAD2DBU4_EUPCR|nr:unnamed protein product [Moneuplotes crassus]